MIAKLVVVCALAALCICAFSEPEANKVLLVEIAESSMYTYNTLKSLLKKSTTFDTLSLTGENPPNFNSSQLAKYTTLILTLAGGDLPANWHILANTFKVSGGRVLVIGGTYLPSGNFAKFMNQYLSASLSSWSYGGDFNCNSTGKNSLGNGLPSDFSTKGSENQYCYTVGDPSVQIGCVNDNGNPALFAKVVGQGALVGFTGPLADPEISTAPGDYPTLTLLLKNMLTANVGGSSTSSSILFYEFPENSGYTFKTLQGLLKNLTSNLTVVHAATRFNPTQLSQHSTVAVVLDGSDLPADYSLLVKAISNGTRLLLLGGTYTPNGKFDSFIKQVLKATLSPWSSAPTLSCKSNGTNSLGANLPAHYSFTSADGYYCYSAPASSVKVACKNNLGVSALYSKVVGKGSVVGFVGSLSDNEINPSSSDLPFIIQMLTNMISADITMFDAEMQTEMQQTEVQQVE